MFSIFLQFLLAVPLLGRAIQIPMNEGLREYTIDITYGLRLTIASWYLIICLSFCPTSAYPVKPIHFNYLPGKCLDVKDGVLANGTPVQM